MFSTFTESYSPTFTCSVCLLNRTVQPLHAQYVNWIVQSNLYMFSMFTESYSPTFTCSVCLL